MPCNLAVTIGKGKVSAEQLLKVLTTPLVSAALEVWASQRPDFTGGVLVNGDTITVGSYRESVTVSPVRHVVVEIVGYRRDQSSARARVTELTKEIESVLSMVAQQAIVAQIQQAIAGMGQVERRDVSVDDEGVTKSATQLRIHF